MSDLLYKQGDFVRLTDAFIERGWPGIGEVIAVTPAQTSPYLLRFSNSVRLRVHEAQIAGPAPIGDVVAFKTKS